MVKIKGLNAGNHLDTGVKNVKKSSIKLFNVIGAVALAMMLVFSNCIDLRAYETTEDCNDMTEDAKATEISDNEYAEEGETSNCENAEEGENLDCENSEETEESEGIFMDESDDGYEVEDYTECEVVGASSTIKYSAAYVKANNVYTEMQSN